MQALWKLRMLGELRLEPLQGDSDPITRFRTQKAALLLAYLVLRPGPQPREVLLALFWPDAELDAARNNLSVTLSSLRHQLEPPGVPTGSVLEADRQQVGLRSGVVTSDVAAFLQAARSGDRATALTLYTGPLLPTFYDDWVLQERIVLAELYRAQLRSLPRAEQAARAYEALQRDPDYADDYVALLPAATLPPPRPVESTPAAEPIAPAPVAIPGGFLPRYPNRFFGREAERARLEALLTEARFVTLTGLGGLGKTRLALETLYTRVERGERVIWVSLAEHTEGRQLFEVLRALLALSPTVEPREAVAVALESAPALLLLDNLEQLGDSVAEPLYWLLTRVSSLRVLATSRRALNVPGEHLLPLMPLPAEQAEAPAVALFVDRAQAALPDFALTPRNTAAVVALCQRLDGIPLALEIVASRARVLTPGQWLEKLEQGLDVVVARARAGLPERHRTLLAALRWSYDLLPPETRRFLTQLAVFRGGWTLEAAEVLTGDPLALDQLAILADNALVLSIPTAEGGLRFRMLETIREFARSVGGDDTVPCSERHLAFFTEQAVARAGQLRQGEAQRAARQWFDHEQDNLRAALEFALAHHPPLALSLGAALARYWERSGAFAEAKARLGPVLALALPSRPEIDRDRSTILLALGNIAHNQGERDRAGQLLEEARALRAALGDDEGVALVLNNLSLLAAQRGELARAQALGEDAIAAHRRAGNATDAAIAQVNLGNLHGYQGDWARAEQLYRAAIPPLEAAAHHNALSSIYANLCACTAHRGDWDDAERFARRSVALKEAQDDPVGLAQSWDTLAEVLLQRGRRDEAREPLHRSIRLLVEREAWRTLPFNLVHLAQLESEARPTWAAQLLGGVDRLLGEIGGHVPEREALAQQLRTVLGEAAFVAAWQRGRTASRQELVAWALSGADRVS